ncbi:CMRF35-like molecule 5 [Hippocampus zosterae]|uniref:CMRF35-like molecule 5 n=1 Tax=Hippocampus zosterae TaxID=109293 RepID=UPI00223DAB37|nr:CMRF35-like molecule 5 [Hippocampus zosterae]
MQESMKILFLVMAFLMQGRANAVVEVTGVSGKDIKITCSHDSAFDNVKYFCNAVCIRDKDVLIKSRDWYSQEKYSIVDARNIFYVTIFHLTKQDAGTYWCGWERVGPDTYQRVVLTVREGSTEEPKEDTPTTEEPKEDEPTTESPEQVPPSTSSSMTPLYIGASLGVITLTTALVLLICFTQQKGKIRTHPGMNDTEDPIFILSAILVQSKV